MDLKRNFIGLQTIFSATTKQCWIIVIGLITLKNVEKEKCKKREIKIHKVQKLLKKNCTLRKEL